MAFMHAIKIRRVVIELDDNSVLEIGTGNMTLENHRFYSGPPERYEVYLRMIVDSVTYSHLAPEQARIEYGPPYLASERNKAIGTGSQNSRCLDRLPPPSLLDREIDPR
jgi:hypothetical protein